MRSRAHLRERVLDPRRHFRIALARDDAGLLERLQALGQGLGADAFQRTLQSAEAVDALRQVAENEERPFAGDDVRRSQYRAGFVACGVVHSAQTFLVARDTVHGPTTQSLGCLRHF